MMTALKLAGWVLMPQTMLIGKLLGLIADLVFDRDVEDDETEAY